MVGHDIYVVKTKLVNWKLLHWELSSPKFKMRPHILHTEICQRMFTQRIARNFKFPSWLISMNSSAFDQKIYRLQNLCHLDTFRGLGSFCPLTDYLWRYLEWRCVGPEHSTQQVNLVQKEDFPFPARQGNGSGTELNWIELVYLCVGKGMTLETPLNFCVNNHQVFAIAVQLSFSHIKHQRLENQNMKR